MFSKKVDFCRSCRLYLPRTEFAASAGPGPPPHGRPCRRCSALGQEAWQRQSFLKLKCLLQRLHSAEAHYEDDPKIAFLMQVGAVGVPVGAEFTGRFLLFHRKKPFKIRLLLFMPIPCEACPSSNFRFVYADLMLKSHF